MAEADKPATRRPRVGAHRSPFDNTQEYRLKTVEDDVRSTAQSVSTLVSLQDQFMSRLKALEDWRNDQNVRDARQEERDKALQKTLEGINASIASLKADVKEGRNSWSKLAWSIINPIILAAMAFALAGGFRNINLP